MITPTLLALFIISIYLDSKFSVIYFTIISVIVFLAETSIESRMFVPMPSKCYHFNKYSWDISCKFSLNNMKLQLLLLHVIQLNREQIDFATKIHFR